ncbi:MAG: hypothetical protein JO353_05030, partial [Phycisphaerae bacterium]|nr:hypothetical protein [Phycisphaerae bacterium]
MYIRMLTSLANPTEVFQQGLIYDFTERVGRHFIQQGIGEFSADPPSDIAALLDRIAAGENKPCLFLPFIGEFGHQVMWHMRYVQFHRASEKIVCCREADRVLYPSATEFVCDWTDPLTDIQRVGTNRHGDPEWTELRERFPNHVPLASGGLSMSQE